MAPKPKAATAEGKARQAAKQKVCQAVTAGPPAGPPSSLTPLSHLSHTEASRVDCSCCVQAAEDKTFGLKNKNKSSKVQK
jgi:hypothetical protein